MINRAGLDITHEVSGLVSTSWTTGATTAAGLTPGADPEVDGGLGVPDFLFFAMMYEVAAASVRAMRVAASTVM